MSFSVPQWGIGSKIYPAMDNKIPRCSSSCYKMVWYLHLGYFHVLATAINIGMHMFFWTMVFSASHMKMKWNEMKVAQLCPTLWDPMDCSQPGSSVHGILQARILEWIVIPSSKASSWPCNPNHVSYVSCIGRPVL